MSSRKLVVKGSERSSVSEAVEIGDVDSHERVEAAIILRPNPESYQSLKQRIDDLSSSKTVRDRSYITSEEFASRSLGSSESDMQLVTQFATANGLEITLSSSVRRTVLVAGESNRLSKTFNVKMKRYRHLIEEVEFRGRSGPVLVPEELGDVVLAVLGLDNRPQARTHFRPLLPNQAAVSSYTPIQLAKLYDFPPEVDGGGQSIGIIELGGGFVQNDLDTYFSSLGIRTPKINAVSVDGGTNAPTGKPSGPDGEVMLDLEVAGSIAPGAQIAVYFAPNTDKGFLDAVTTAIHDQQNRPSMISISWGSAENTWTSQARRAFNQAFQDSSTLGLTICVAAGDCLVKGSLVYTTDGPVPIEDSIGRRVYSLVNPSILLEKSDMHSSISYKVSEDITASRIVAVLPQPLRPAFSVRTATRTIKGTENHPLLVYENRKLEWRPIGDLKVGDKLIIVKQLPEIREESVDSIDHRLIRLVGGWIGDGYTRIRSGNGGDISWCIPPGDLRDTYRRLLSQLFPNTHISEDKQRIHIYNQEVRNTFVSLGCSPSNAKSRRVPKWIFRLTQKDLLHFYQGYLETDGHVRYLKPHKKELATTLAHEFECASSGLMEDIRCVALKLGFRASNITERTRTSKIFHGRKCRHCTWTTWNLRVYPEAKHNSSGGGASIGSHQFHKTKFLGLERIREIRPLGLQETFDIKVENTHNFIAEGVPAHNSGSSDGQTDSLAHVDFPASDPFVLGCGGTRLLSKSREIKSEVVWNDESIGGGATGGGVSDVFSLPIWQQKVGVPPSANPGGRIGRGVPDVSGDADPATGYQVRVDGQSTVFGGTSAVAPLWSALLALLAQKLGKPVGFVNPIFYDKLVTIQSGAEVERGFDDITQGNNGAYKAGVGWDACTGLGSPDGLKLLKAL